MTAGVAVAVGAMAAVAWWFRPGTDRSSRRPAVMDAAPVGLVTIGLVAIGLVVVGPAAVLAVAALWLVVRWWRPRRAAGRRRAAVASALPHAVDVLATSLEAGRPLAGALRETVRWAPDALHDELALAVERLDAGWRRVDVLDRLVDDLGPEVRPRVSALLATDRYGVPVADAVRGLVDDMRRRRRLDAEAAARRLPVRLTVPLVVAVLPAFGLLTVLPLLLAALRGLGADPGP